MFYYLQVVYDSGVFFNFEDKTSGLKNLILDSAFQSITIKNVPLEEQDKIAEILSRIDEKVAVNHAINVHIGRDRKGGMTATVCGRSSLKTLRVQSSDKGWWSMSKRMDWLMRRSRSDIFRFDLILNGLGVLNTAPSQRICMYATTSPIR